MRTLLLAIGILTAAASAQATSFYGAIRMSNNGIPGSGVSLSTSLIDFFPAIGPPNGQAIVQMVGGVDAGLGPTVGSAVLLKDFVPGSFVTDEFSFATMSPGPGYDGSISVLSHWPVWDSFSPYGPPFFFGDNYPGLSCTPNPSPFCVSPYLSGESIAYFFLRGGTTNQLGFWEAIFGAVLPMPSALAQADLAAGQTLVSTQWMADVATGSEPGTGVTLIGGLCVILLARLRRSQAWWPALRRMHPRCAVRTR
ncbi:MAG TPA: hypothetical protein VMJ75_13295 [Candidatus Acidoferrales bacterium]|nr:hypothetical protein [Candidatus Acidoferrales bacterium]HTS64344.1 hypothetical protein [Candidatus Acidoferrales bacterium]